MNDAVEIEVNVGGVRLAIAVRVAGGEVLSVRPGPAPRSPQGGQASTGYGGSQAQGQRPAPASGGGQQRESIIPAINEARERHGLADARGAGVLARFMGVERFTVKAVEEWLRAGPGRTLDGLARGAASSGGQR
ncbi:MAG: hypothetical protein IT302_10945 [Dehalococcoidia bacterium]|nr:hypothetical protein [Dehalococcoidia bacterium]